MLNRLWMLSIPAGAGVFQYMNLTMGTAIASIYAPYLILAPILVKSLNKAAFYWKGYYSVCEMWLLQNGDQVLIKTYDGIYHKLPIQEITNYRMVDKSSHMDIVINNCGKKYTLSTKNKTYVNFTILDRIIKGVCIQTNRAEGKVKTPPNLRAKVIEIDPSKVLNLGAS